MSSNQGHGIIVHKRKPKPIHCVVCNQPITTVSTTLYEIDAKHYCSECYIKTVANAAAERDHSDLKIKKS